jgi:hypothetical protein
MVMPCSPFEVNVRFGGTCRLHLQADPDDVGDVFLRNVG